MKERATAQDEKVTKAALLKTNENENRLLVNSLDQDQEDAYISLKSLLPTMRIN